MKNQTQTANNQPRRVSFKSNTLQYTLIAFFIAALILLVSSHRALHSHADFTQQQQQQQQLLSVPLPKRQVAAKGGSLPPIPDSVKQKIAGSRNRNDYTSPGAESEALSSPIPSFPLPSDAVPKSASSSTSSEIILQPTFGSHRPNQNAVFAFAEGYDLNVYVTFIESLKNTGYTGDVVLSVSHIDGMKRDVQEYLKWYSSQDKDDSLRVVSYALEWECYKKSGVRILPTNNEGRGSTTNHGFSDCKIDGLYSDVGVRKKDNSNNNTHPSIRGEAAAVVAAMDPREARPVATARYELYWIWSRQYHPDDSSILIVDVRDTYFQSNPFDFRSSSSPALGTVHLPANQQQQSNNEEECRLDLFEENYEAVNIAKSQYNSRWIKVAYGQKALKEVSSKPVICSGSTMGSQRAIELYSIAMVAQFDKTKCKQVGCDQGFHNYLYYEGGLKPFLESHDCTINVHRQGDGAVNNLAAMRNSPLRDQGVVIDGKANDGIVVVNNDKSTPSPVVHQFDRDKELKVALRKKTSSMLAQWRSSIR